MSEEQIEALIDYATKQVRWLVESAEYEDLENNKDKQRLYLALERLFDEINVTMADVLPRAIYNRYLDGLSLAEDLIPNAGMGAVDVGSKGVAAIVKAPIHVEAITNIVSDTLEDLSAAIRTAKTYSFKELDKAIDGVHTELANGLIAGFTHKQIAKRVAEKFGKQGMTSFVTSDGKHLPLDFYAKTVTRTKLQTAENHAHLNRYKERKVKHVEVSGNIPTCGECAVYRGLVFATEAGDSFPHIDLHKTFPVHPNCRCNFRPYITKFKSKEEIEERLKASKAFDPNKDNRSKAEAKKYDANQKAKAAARRQRLTFVKLNSQLGKDGPQSFKQFKNASKRQYHDWVAQAKKLYDPHKQEVIDDGPKEIETVDYTKLDYTTPEDFEKVSNDYAQTIFKRMDPSEIKAIKDYTYLDYQLINEYIRDKSNGNLDKNIVELHPEVYGHIKTYADDLVNMYDKYDMQLQDDVTLYRGVYNREFEDMLDKVEIKDGREIYTLDNLKSTSIEKSVTKDFSDGWTIHIKARKGSQVISLQSISELQNEKEFLIKNGQQFEIEKVDVNTNDLYVYLI
ncbi:phage minor capsid protein [Staphylococcus sp. LKG3-3]|uniref:phage minor capsid protein n=1 Tax=Staphylococcus sp. LKG3-3 TaxID=3399685 RepID=UPI003D964234